MATAQKKISAAPCHLLRTVLSATVSVGPTLSALTPTIQLTTIVNCCPLQVSEVNEVETCAQKAENSEFCVLVNKIMTMLTDVPRDGTHIQTGRTCKMHTEKLGLEPVNQQRWFLQLERQFQTLHHSVSMETLRP